MATRNKKSTIQVDFSDTETQATLEEGDYVLEVDEVEQKKSEAGNPYLSLSFKVAEGPFKGKKVYHNCSLQPQALFNLRGVLEALGFEVPQGVMDLDPADMVGEKCGASIVHEDYQGKTKARPAEFFPADEVGEEAEPAKVTKVTKPVAEPEPPAKVTKKKARAAPAFAVGDKVTFTDDEGDEQAGVISAIEDDTYTVTTGKGKTAAEWELELGDLTAA